MMRQMAIALVPVAIILGVGPNSFLAPCRGNNTKFFLLLYKMTDIKLNDLRGDANILNRFRVPPDIAVSFSVNRHRSVSFHSA